MLWDVSLCDNSDFCKHPQPQEKEDKCLHDVVCYTTDSVCCDERNCVWSRTGRTNPENCGKTPFLPLSV